MIDEENKKTFTSIIAIVVTLAVCGAAIFVGVSRNHSNRQRAAMRNRTQAPYRVMHDQPIVFNVPEGTTSVVVKDCYPKNDSRVWICHIKLNNGGNNVSRNGNE